MAEDQFGGSFQGQGATKLTHSATLTPGRPYAASFRDPAGSLFSLHDRIFRFVNPAGMEDLNAFLSSKTGRTFLAVGAVAQTKELTGEARAEVLEDPGAQEIFAACGGQMVLEHERIPFPSYPYEWAPEMLHAAGVLTLDLAEQLLAENLGLKDATPYNVLFRGAQPVFIDLLSFERREAGDAIWLPYAQFVRTFLLPLVANREFGIGLDHILLTRRDGLDPEEVYRWTGPLQRLRPPFLSLVSMPTWLASRQDPDDTRIYQKKLLPNAEKAQFILRSVLRRLRRALRRLTPKEGQRSVWSDYMQSNNNYTGEHFEAKERFVREALAECASRRVLDIGCNTGHFSALAARSGARVVAIDYDPVVAGAVWRAARNENLDILPLVVNLTRPTPGVGWQNRECPSFLERAAGAFDMTLMLAVIHHMLVTERAPLADILGLAAQLTRKFAIIEFVGPEDSMFKRLVRGREELHRGLTNEVFEGAARAQFEVIRSQHLPGTGRWLYLLRKRI